ncbi:hypothetical protein QF20_004376 [Salmonella enterica subsp. enterica]|uniref:Uncharacterized protein n=1 Tax=Salmonella enterica TaxID=28901 RepID=A0A749ZBS9_SALER|nr:hypothetical protein [Salmonella enterica subsp. enterica serovar Mikawasima]EDT6676445.1 hypothetical protein [Salmonella enterica subsp. enterica]EDV1420965.1 hypothetical protein [Salmonella enterica subsp. salamae]HAF6043918.1 hypothetical protein [Salmonella enterica]EDV4903338.1 hypothetical protein [Salmonella enterica subsp. enterica]
MCRSASTTPPHVRHRCWNPRTAVVAIAAKNARLCWASLHYGDDFRLYSAS